MFRKYLVVLKQKGNDVINYVAFVFLRASMSYKRKIERYEGTEMNIVWNHVHERSHSIEINYVNDKKEILTRVYFRYDPKVCTS